MELQKEGIGSVDYRTDEEKNIAVYGWYDNKRVIKAFNYIGADEGDTCNRWEKKTKTMIDAPRPTIVKTYKAFMGGVDKADMMLALYKTMLRTRKWYLRIAFHAMSMSVVNAWVIYRQLGGSGPLLSFLMDVCRCLLVGNLGTTTAVADVANNHPQSSAVRGES